MPQPLAVPSRTEALAAHRAAGGRVAAVFPVHNPRALLRAFGLLPVEVWGPPGRSTAGADAHLQGYTCSMVRCGLSFALGGGLAEVDAAVVPHTCDTLQGLGSLLLDLAPPGVPVVPLYLPRGNRVADADFLAAELRAAAERLAQALGRRPADREVLAAVVREEGADDALAALLGARGRLGLSNEAFYRLVRAREYLPAEAFEPLARAAAAGPEADPPGVPILLSGLVPEPAALLGVLDRAGVYVAADDLASSGRRQYRAAVSQDPFARLAQSLLSGPPDPSRGCGVQERCDHLVGLAKDAGTVGALLWTVKFCEPEQFYLPEVRRALEAAGVRCLALEVDLADPLPSAAVTRIEAFAETLS